MSAIEGKVDIRLGNALRRFLITSVSILQELLLRGVRMLRWLDSVIARQCRWSWNNGACTIVSIHLLQGRADRESV